MKSRQPKRTDVLKAQGTYKPGRHADRVTMPPASGDPAPPADFTDRHVYWWRHYIKDIKGFAELSESHLNAVAMLCRLMVDREKLEADIAAAGYTFKTKSGQVKINPAFTARMALDKDIIKLFEQFGFTLRSSMNLKVSKPKGPSKILEMMAGGKSKVS